MVKTKQISVTSVVSKKSTVVKTEQISGTSVVSKSVRWLKPNRFQ